MTQASITVMASQGDTVDAICHRHLNNTEIVEQVLTANPHIAFLGAILPSGTMLQIPQAATKPQKQLTQLWD